MTELSIRVIGMDDHDALRACEEVQRLTWDYGDTDVVPMHMLVAFVFHGGHVLGAYDGDRMVGFLTGYAGYLPRDDERVPWVGSRSAFASQMMGILPGYQNTGLGYRLKTRQREMLLADGFNLATWTFDPLLSRNAYFNITRLGVTIRHYIRNIYDEFPGINAGMPTDRLEAEWWLDSPHVEKRLFHSEHRIPQPPARAWQAVLNAPLINPSRPAPGEMRAPSDSVAGLDAPYALVEIPLDINTIKAVDIALARAWRFQIREVMEAAFDEGYVIGWFSSGVSDGTGCSHYVLTRKPVLPAMPEEDS